MLSAERDELRQLGYISFHAEDAVGDDPATGLARVSLESGLEIGEVAVFIDLARDRFADEADAVDDAGVVQLVGENDVVGTYKRLEYGFVGVPAAGVG